MKRQLPFCVLLCALVAWMAGCSNYEMPVLVLDDSIAAVPSQPVVVVAGEGTDSVRLGMLRAALEARLGSPVNNLSLGQVYQRAGVEYTVHYGAGDSADRILLFADWRLVAARRVAVDTVRPTVAWHAPFDTVRAHYGHPGRIEGPGGAELEGWYYDSLGIAFHRDPSIGNSVVGFLSVYPPR